MIHNFISPVMNARITSKFGWRVLNGRKEWHQGIDLASPTPGKKVDVFASRDGKVIRVGVLGTYGKIVMLEHNVNGNRYETNYAHLDSSCVKLGQVIKQGQKIGVMGNTGGSYGVHLHFEIHRGKWATSQPNAIDPQSWIDFKNNPDGTRMKG